MEVEVDEAGVMGRREAAAGLEEDVEDRRGGAWLAEPDPEVAALDVFHDHEDLVREHADLVHGDDGGVAETGEGPALAQDLAQPAVAAGVQDLEGDLAVEVRVVGEKDRAHAAAAERAQHGEAAKAERLVVGSDDSVADPGAQGAGEHIGLRRADRHQGVDQVGLLDAGHGGSGAARWRPIVEGRARRVTRSAQAGRP
nr:hypothetical protein [Nannocystis sp.]